MVLPKCGVAVLAVGCLVTAGCGSSSHDSSDSAAAGGSTGSGLLILGVGVGTLARRRAR